MNGTNGSALLQEQPGANPRMVDQCAIVGARLGVKKEQRVESINTEDASQFFERMAGLIRMAGPDQPLPSEISDTLDQLLNGYGTSTDVDNGFGSLGEGSTLRSSSPVANTSSADAGLDSFFDFSSFGMMDDDAESEAPMPDLVTSANPSPGSDSEANIGHHPSISDIAKIADPKDNGLDGFDPLRLRAWREIDGGETSYYQAVDNFKWDGSMPTADQPWEFSA